MYNQRLWYNFVNILIILATIFGSIKSQDDSINNDDLPIGRLHIQKCREYQLNVNEICGYKKVELIEGQTLAAPKEFPHMALLGYNNGTDIHYECAGTLISDRYILTAAHCTFYKHYGELKIVRLGDLDTTTDTDDANPKNYNIEEIFIYPDYNNTEKQFDLALLKLTENVELNAYIRPACLPTEFDNREKNLIATGWGTTPTLINSPSPHLKKIILQKYDFDECQKIYKEKVGKKAFESLKHNSQICAGSKTLNIGTCQGDSGGPIQVYHNNNYCMYTIIGITSFGLGCGVGTPGIYKRVFPYVDWIENIVWKN